MISRCGHMALGERMAWHLCARLIQAVTLLRVPCFTKLDNLPSHHSFQQMPSNNPKDDDEKKEEKQPPKNNEEKSTRAERKRNREQKRRNEVNEGLDQLAKLVFMVDPQLKADAEDRARKTQSGVSITAAPKENHLLSRVELVNSAVATLSRVHRENEMNKMIIQQLMRGGMSAGGMPPLVGAPNPLLPFGGLGSAAGIMGLTMAGMPGVTGANPQAAVAAAATAVGETVVAEASVTSPQGKQKESAAAEEKDEKETEKEEDGPATKRLKRRQKSSGST